MDFKEYLPWNLLPKLRRRLRDDTRKIVKLEEFVEQKGKIIDYERRHRDELIMEKVKKIQEKYTTFQRAAEENLRELLRRNIRGVDPKLISETFTAKEKFHYLFDAISKAEENAREIGLAPIGVISEGKVLYRSPTFNRRCNLSDYELSTVVCESYEKFSSHKEIKIDKGNYDLILRRGTLDESVVVGIRPKKGKRKTLFERLRTGAMPVVMDTLESLRKVSKPREGDTKNAIA